MSMRKRGRAGLDRESKVGEYVLDPYCGRYGTIVKVEPRGLVTIEYDLQFRDVLDWLVRLPREIDWVSFIPVKGYRLGAWTMFTIWVAELIFWTLRGNLWRPFVYSFMIVLTVAWVRATNRWLKQIKDVRSLREQDEANRRITRLLEQQTGVEVSVKKC